MSRDETEPGPLRDESICAVLPAYNESENLREVVRELANVLEADFGNWQIMVIDDGSTDGTAAPSGAECRRTGDR